MAPLNDTTRSIVCTLLVLGMLTSTVPLPAGAAGPEGIRVGEVEPGDCLSLEADPQELVETLPSNASEAENETRESPDNRTEDAKERLRENESVPTLCGVPANGTANQALNRLIQAGNQGIRTINQALARLDNESLEVDRSDRIPFLKEPFDGERVGGLGSWSVRTAGDETGFRQPVHPNVTDGYALTDAPGAEYEHGLDTTLVSPAVDLGGVALNQTVASFPQRVEQILQNQLPEHPPVFTTENRQSGTDLDVCLSLPGQQDQACTFRGPLGDAVDQLYGPLREAYIETAENVTETWANRVGAATLEVRHRYNLAHQLDGVRYEVLTSPPPERGLPPEGTPIEPVDDEPGHRQKEVAAMDGSEAFTGRSDGWVTRTFDLSRFAGERVWIVAHARTSSAFAIGGFFEDPALFPDGTEHLGYQLADVRVNATAHRSNLRALQIDAGQAPLDGTPTVPPPLDQKNVDVAVTNQGQHPSTARVQLEQCRDSTCRSRTLGTVDMVPGEVAHLRTGYPFPHLTRGNTTLTATVENASTDPGPTNTSTDAQPSDNSRSVKLAIERVARLHVHEAPQRSLGLSVDPLQGDPKTQRTITMRVENTGNVPATGAVRLSVEDTRTGQDRAGWITDGPKRSVDLEPGATRELSWTLVPKQPGVLRVTASVDTGGEVTGHANPSAHVYVQRSPGAVCVDDFERQRDCGAQWQRGAALPVRPRAVADAATGPDGTVFLLLRNETVLGFDGTEWNRLGEADGARWLATTNQGVRAIDTQGAVYRVSLDGLQRTAASIPIQRVETVGLTPNGRLLAAGRIAQHDLAPVALAVQNGTGYRTLTSPEGLMPNGNLDVTGVVGASEELFALAVVETDKGTGDDRQFAHLCTADSSFPDTAIQCHARPGGPATVEVPNEAQMQNAGAGNRDPVVDVGRRGANPVLVVESPMPPNQRADGSGPLVPGDCEETRDPVSGAASVALGTYCFYLLDTSKEEGLRTIGGAFGAASRRTVATAGGTTWVIQAPDADADGVENARDNCPTIPNDEQDDKDGDGLGDLCDENLSGNVIDHDGDGVETARDNCPETSNPDQTDTDRDGIGDACGTFDADKDNDGVENKIDNCPHVPNPDQKDTEKNTEKDDLGDKCDDHPDQADPDHDGDKVGNSPDNCPHVPNPNQDDQDDDGLGDACDEEHDAPLYKLDAGRFHEAPAAVQGPPETIAVALGGGVEAAVAVGPDRVYTLAGAQADLSVSTGDWDTFAFLEGQHGEQAWSADISGVTQRFGQGRQGVVVRESRGALTGTCENPSVQPGVETGIPPSVDPEVDVPRCFTLVHQRDPITESSVGARPVEHANLTLRLAARELPNGTMGVRALVDPTGSTSGDIPTAGQALPGTGRLGQTVPPPSGGRSPVGTAADTYRGLEGLLNQAWGTPIPETGTGVETVVSREGGVDEGDRVESGEDEGVFSPTRVPLGQVSTTRYGWFERSFDVKEGLAERVAERGQARVIGVELVFPPGTRAAVDAAWLNVSRQDEPEQTVLFTDGSGNREGSWSGNGGVDDGARTPFGGTPGRGWRFVEAGHRRGILWDDECGDESSDSDCGEEIPVRTATPVIDLREAEDPLLTFRHAYDFDSNSEGFFSFGTVQAQAKLGPDAWSPWVRIDPEGGYPDDVRDGHPAADSDERHYVANNLPPTKSDELGHTEELGVSDPPAWETEVFDLANQTAPLAGNQIRLGFFAQETRSDLTPEWLVSDLRVLADASPDVDGAVEGVDIEGFNASQVGLPPGQQVTLNVTVANRGAVPIDRARIAWELVGVGRSEAPIAQGSTPIASLDAGARSWFSIPATVPAADLSEVLFEDDPKVYLRVRLDRVHPGDEDATNNVGTVGTLTDPLELEATERFRVGVDVSPPSGGPTQTRGLRVLLENTGNVPVEGVTVDRTILEARGGAGFEPVPGHARTYETTRPLAPGASRPLATLAPDVSQTDRRFTPGTTGTFLVRAEASAGDVHATAEQTVTASRGYLTASGEEPARGLGTEGRLDPQDAWRLSSPGVFGSANAWRLDTEGAGGDGSGEVHRLRLPTVDLSTARDPVLSMYHKYSFEDRYDGGRLEASVDGGHTWEPVDTISSGPAGYGRVLGGNPLADDSVTTPAFTGNSSGAGFDGWVLSQFDLAGLPALQAPGARSVQLTHVEEESRFPTQAPKAASGLDTVYSHPSWRRGSEDPTEGFTVENLSQPMPADDHGPRGFLHSGTGAQIDTDETQPGVQGRFCAELSVRVPRLASGERAAVEFWTWRPVRDGASEVQVGLAQMHGYDSLGDPPNPPAPGDEPADLFANLFKLNNEANSKTTEDLWTHHRRVLPADYSEDQVGLNVWLNPDRAAHPGIVVDGLRVVTFQEHPSGPIDRQVVREEPWGSRQSCNTGDSDGQVVEEVDPPHADDGANAWHVVELPPEIGTGKAFSTSPMVETPPTVSGVPDRIFDAPNWTNARLVLPSLDLTRVDGNVSLSFDHQAAFRNTTWKAGAVPASGGVVEVSVQDPVTRTWGPWRQIYEKPGQVDNVTCDRRPPCQAQGDLLGGYTANGTGLREEEDGPFENHLVPEPLIPGGGDPDANDGREYVFRQPTAQQTHGITVSETRVDPTWENASFPLDRFVGERIRVAFHAYIPGGCTFEDTYANNGENDPSEPGWQPSNADGGDVITCPTNGERWLIQNLTVHRPLFDGQPVQLRLAAGTDGSVDEARWSVDEIGVRAEPWSRNVGVTVGDRPELVGSGQTATLEGTIRNRGSVTRSDVAVRARLDGVPGEVDVQVEGADAAEGSKDVSSPAFTLLPGEARSFHVNATPEAVSGDGRVVVEAVQWNDGLGRYTELSNEQVISNLQRSIPLDVLEPGIQVLNLTLEPNRVQPGDPATLVTRLANPATEPLPVQVTCQVHRIRGWVPTDHATTDEDTPITSPSPVPCRPIDGDGTLAPGVHKRQFEIQPPEDGVYDVQLRLRPAGEPDELLDTARTKLWAGDAPLIGFFDFESEDGRDGRLQGQGWSAHFDPTPGREEEGSPTTVTTDETAARGNWSVRLGISQQAFEAGERYASEMNHSIRSPAIDLHNVTSGRVALSFFHKARLAYGDGADVRARVLVDEASRDWSDWTKLHPVGGYEGYVASFHTWGRCSSVGTPGPGAEANADTSCPGPDHNPALSSLMQRPSNFDVGFHREPGFFGSTRDPQTGPTPRIDDRWHRSVVPLHLRPPSDPQRGPDDRTVTVEGHPLVGNTVQFEFALHKGEEDGDPPTQADIQRQRVAPDPLERGRGQAWYIDSVAIAATNLTMEPETVTAPIVDNATKRYPARLSNAGAAAEIVNLTVDRARSSVTAEQAWTSGTTVVPANGSATGDVNVRFGRDPFALPFQHTIRVEPEGTLNPNAADETRLQLRFDPRTWPDLSVEVLEPTEDPIEGVPTLVPVQVKNHGLDRAPPTELRFTAVHDGNASIQRVSVPSIPPASVDPGAATTSVFVPWTPGQEAAGNHTLEVAIDPNGTVPEYTEADNEDARGVDVAPLRLPDLQVQGDELTVSTAEGQPDTKRQGPLVTHTVPAGTLTTVTVPVANTGDAPAKNVDVRLFLGSITLPPKRIPRLDPGQQAEVSFTFVARQGVQELSVEATTSSRDPDTANNRAPREETVRLRALDFALSVTAPEQVTADAGKPATVPVNLTNRGGLGVLVQLEPQTPSHVTLEPERTELFLEPGQTATVPTSVGVQARLDGGDHPVRLVARSAEDPSDAVTTELTVHRPPVHDLKIRAEQDELPPGPSTLPVTLDNAGNLAETLSLEARLNGTAITRSNATATVDRGARALVELPVSVPPDVAPGEHELTIVAQGTTDERHRTTVELSDTARPVLRTNGSQARFHAGGLTVPLTVENLGNAPFEGRVELPLDATGRVQPSTVSLAPGASADAELTLPEPANRSSARLSLRGDGSTPDATQRIALPDARPNLRILQHELDRAPPGAERPTRLEVTVGNPSNAHVAAAPLGVYLDDQLAVRKQLPALGPDAAHTVTIEWPRFDEPHAISVSAGVPFGVPDEDPSDNAVTVSIPGSQGALAQLVDRLREAPGPGFEIAIAALALAVAVARKRRPGGPEG